jgi:TIR domain
VYRRDFFLSYAGEDRKAVAEPLAKALKQLGFDVWYAPWELKPGDSLRRRIDDGLATSRFGVVVSSKHFFRKGWTNYELDGLVQQQIRGFTRIIPIWHQVDDSHVANFSPSLADKIAFNTKEGAAGIAKGIAQFVRDVWRERLTPEDPKDEAENDEKWRRCTSSPFMAVPLSTLIGSECAWVYRFEAGIEINDVELAYFKNPGPKRYDRFMPKLVRRTLSSWEPADPTEKRRLFKEPFGNQVRLERVHLPHSSYKLTLSLSPTKFLYYRAIQARLWESNLRSLRNSAFENSLDALNTGEPLLLPSNFAIHMSVVSKEGMALLRQRTAFTPLYPSAWEAGVGEFMHGPRRKYFRHFDKRGRPSLALFLTNAVEEELKYKGAQPKDFRIFGFAVEYRTLAPKLLVVYRSNASISKLLKGAGEAKDRSPAVQYIKLTPKELVKAMTDAEKFPTCGPTSKLALSLALLQTARSELHRRALVEELSRLTSMAKT